MKKFICDFTKEELEQKLKPSFRAKQVFQWIYQKYCFDFMKMDNLPKSLREELSKEYIINPLDIVTIETSKDGTKKYLFSLNDNLTVESVLIPMKDKHTICISTQVGCKMGCSFCYTAKGGFKRNLTPAEIVFQVALIKKDNNIPHTKSVNIVFMGMGEPLDNFDNVVKAIKIFKDEDGLSISPRRQTISTSGLSSKIEELGKLDLKVLLAISLHAVDDELRNTLMPINKAYNISSVINAVKKFPIDTRKRVLFEYLVIKDTNDSIEDAKKLVKLLNGIKAKVNLIPFNPHPGSPFQRPTTKNLIKFQDYLSSKGITCTIRASKGEDISAACGQLKEKVKNDNP